MSKMYIFIRKFGKYFVICTSYVPDSLAVSSWNYIFCDNRDNREVIIAIIAIWKLIQSSKDNTAAMEATLEPWRHPEGKEAHLEPRRLTWSQGGSPGAKEAHLEPKRLTWRGGSPGAKEAHLVPRRLTWSRRDSQWRHGCSSLEPCHRGSP